MRDGVITLPVPRVQGLGRCPVIGCDGLATVTFAADGTAHVSFFATRRDADEPDNLVVARLAMPKLAMAQAVARVCLALHEHEQMRRNPLHARPVRGRA